MFFDMDGVLCDFVGGALKAHGKSLPATETEWDFMTQIGFAGGGDPEFWKPLENPAFWAGLEPLDDGMGLFARAVDAYGADRIGILSSGLCPGSCDGKRQWIDRHLPGFGKHAVFCTRKQLCAAPCKVLVDDHGPNVTAFIGAGGWGVLAPRPWNERKSATGPAGEFHPDAAWVELRATVRTAERPSFAPIRSAM